jgi:Alginate export
MRHRHRWNVRTLVIAAGLGMPATAVAAQGAVSEPGAPGPSVATGGEVRQQYERFANEDWGAEAPDRDGYWLQRYMWHVDARMSSHLRLFVELKSGIERGRAGGPRPPDEDRLDLHQGFVDVTLGSVTWRLGRQELAFGSQRLVSAREGPNVRQTFDAGSMIIVKSPWRMHGFGGRYVRTNPGVFDDASDTGRALWGLYLVRALVGQARGIDLYYLGYLRRHATFDQGQGRELRHSWGARLWKASGPLDYNIEAAIQTGRFAHTDIRAWTLASDTGFRVESAVGRPRLGLRADVTSGDRDRDDGRLGTFNPMFPRGAYFGLIAAAGPSNHMDVHPQLSVSIGRRVEVTTSWLLFWRRQVDDGIYGIPGQLLRSGAATRSRFVGHSPGIEAEWEVTGRLTVTANASLFTAGPFIRDTPPARTSTFVAGWATYRF